MRSITARVLAALRRDPWFAVVVTVGLLARAGLIPIAHGQDFIVWDRASAASLRGINIYAHHPRYPGGPYAYFPLFLYVELPFQWIAQHFALGSACWASYRYWPQISPAPYSFATPSAIAKVARGGRQPP